MSRGIKYVREGYAEGGRIPVYGREGDITHYIDAPPETTSQSQPIASFASPVTRGTLTMPEAPAGVYAGHYVPGRPDRASSPFGFADYARGSQANPFAQLAGLRSPEFIPIQSTRGRGYESIYGANLPENRFDVTVSADPGVSVTPLTTEEKVNYLRQIAAATAPVTNISNVAYGGAGGTGGAGGSTGPVTATGGTSSATGGTGGAGGSTGPVTATGGTSSATGGAGGAGGSTGPVTATGGTGGSTGPVTATGGTGGSTGPVTATGGTSSATGGTSSATGGAGGTSSVGNVSGGTSSVGNVTGGTSSVGNVTGGTSSVGNVAGGSSSSTVGNVSGGSSSSTVGNVSGGSSSSTVGNVAGGSATLGDIVNTATGGTSTATGTGGTSTATGTGGTSTATGTGTGGSSTATGTGTGGTSTATGTGTAGGTSTATGIGTGTGTGAGTGTTAGSTATLSQIAGTRPAGETLISEVDNRNGTVTRVYRNNQTGNTRMATERAPMAPTGTAAGAGTGTSTGTAGGTSTATGTGGTPIATGTGAGTGTGTGTATSTAGTGAGTGTTAGSTATLSQIAGTRPAGGTTTAPNEIVLSEVRNSTTGALVRDIYNPNTGARRTEVIPATPAPVQGTGTGGGLADALGSQTGTGTGTATPTAGTGTGGFSAADTQAVRDRMTGGTPSPITTSLPTPAYEYGGRTYSSYADLLKAIDDDVAARRAQQSATLSDLGRGSEADSGGGLRDIDLPGDVRSDLPSERGFQAGDTARPADPGDATGLGAGREPVTSEELTPDEATLRAYDQIRREQELPLNLGTAPSPIETVPSTVLDGLNLPSPDELDRRASAQLSDLAAALDLEIVPSTVLDAALAAANQRGQDNLNYALAFTGGTLNVPTGAMPGTLGGHVNIGRGDFEHFADVLSRLNPNVIVSNPNTGVRSTVRDLQDILANLPPDQRVTPSTVTPGGVSSSLSLDPSLVELSAPPTPDFETYAGDLERQQRDDEERNAQFSRDWYEGRIPGSPYQDNKDEEALRNLEDVLRSTPAAQLPGDEILAGGSGEEGLTGTSSQAVSPADRIAQDVMGRIGGMSPSVAANMGVRGEYDPNAPNASALQGLAAAIGAAAPFSGVGIMGAGIPVVGGTLGLIGSGVVDQLGLNRPSSPALSAALNPIGTAAGALLGEEGRKAVDAQFTRETAEMARSYADQVLSGNMSPSMAATAAAQDLGSVGRLGAVLDAIDQAAQIQGAQSGEVGSSESSLAEAMNAAADFGGQFGGYDFARGGHINMGHLVDHIKRQVRKDLARGGYVPGHSGGMDDDVPAVIDGRRPARLSSGEFVFDAATVAALGDGNNAAGAKKLNQLRHAIRQKAYGHRRQPPKNYSLGDLVGMA